MHMAFLSRGFKNLQWYSMTTKTPETPVFRELFHARKSLAGRVVFGIQKSRKNLPAVSASYDPSCVCSIVQFWWPPIFREAHFDILRVLNQSEKLLIRL